MIGFYFKQLALVISSYKDKLSFERERERDQVIAHAERMANPTILSSSKSISSGTHRIIGTTKPFLGFTRRCGKISCLTDKRGTSSLSSTTRFCSGKTRRLPLERRGNGCSTKAGETGGCVVEKEEEEKQIGYFVSEYGWGVRRMAKVGEEMRRVAFVQAEAFHVPVALFDDFFFQFFQAEVLSALIYRFRSSEPDRYACLVAEPIDASNLLSKSLQGIVGVVDVTVQSDDDVLLHLQGAEEYLYVSGIAVLKNYRRKKIASVLLKACDVVSNEWGIHKLALRAYEDDMAARNLYANAGYEVVSRDPRWMTWIGKRRRVLMIKST